MNRLRIPSIAVGILLAGILSACDDPSGPGAYSGSVDTERGAPGSALLLVTGEGLIRAEGTGGTLGWSSAVSLEPEEMRILLVDPDPLGPMTFRLFVEDISGPTPSFTVLQLADRENALFTAEEPRIRIER